jgi:PAS domain S-box-containing protein
VPKTRILVVEDEAIVARDISQQLARLGYEPAAETDSGETAIALVGELRPDLVLMDIQLAGALDGIAAATTIREQFATPVVFLTAFADEPILQRSKQAEPFGYIVKPFDERELYSVIEISLHKHRAESVLRRSQQELAAILRTALDGFWLCDTEGKILDVNASACQILGYTKEELLRLSVPDIEASMDTAAVSATTAKLILEGTARFESRHRRKDGRIIDVEVSANVLPEPVARMVGFVRDITERKRAEAALRESEAKFSTTFRSAPLMIALSSVEDGTYIEVNREFLRALGFTPAEVIGQSSVDVGAMAPAERERLLEILRRDGRVSALPLTFTGKTGRKLECLYSAETVEIAGETRLLSTALDITEQRRLEAQLRQAQKMEAVGQLAGGVAHDFNNLLASITLNLGLLRDSPGLDQEAMNSFRELEKETARGASLTRQLLAFSRQQAIDIKPLLLNEVLENLLKMLRRALGERISVELHAQPNLPAVEADVGMLEQVVVNLCVNARDATRGGGRLSLATDTLTVSPDYAQAHLPARPGRYVRLSISDTGCGMDATTLARIFEPFFTTKDVGQGTGLGLAIVDSVVKQHGGWVEVESSLGLGTTFRVLLPASQLRVETALPEASSPLQRGHNELLLVVEDEASVRTVLSISLRRYGYRVLLAGNAREALDQWATHRTEISLVLTDMVLPGGTTGIELIQRFRTDRPEVPVILASGYMKAKEVLTIPRVRGLPKPFEMHTLLETLRSCLDGPRVAQAPSASAGRASM